MKIKTKFPLLNKCIGVMKQIVSDEYYVVSNNDNVNFLALSDNYSAAMQISVETIQSGFVRVNKSHKETKTRNNIYSFGELLLPDEIHNPFTGLAIEGSLICTISWREFERLTKAVDIGKLKNQNIFSLIKIKNQEIYHGYIYNACTVISDFRTLEIEKPVEQICGMIDNKFLLKVRRIFDKQKIEKVGFFNLRGDLVIVLKSNDFQFFIKLNKAHDKEFVGFPVEYNRIIPVMYTNQVILSKKVLQELVDGDCSEAIKFIIKDDLTIECSNAETPNKIQTKKLDIQDHQKIVNGREMVINKEILALFLRQIGITLETEITIFFSVGVKDKTKSPLRIEDGRKTLYDLNNKKAFIFAEMQA